MKTKTPIRGFGEVILTEHVALRGYYVYALYDGDNVAYIGSSKNVLGRLGSWIDKPAFFDKIGIMRCPSRDSMNETENFLIKTYGPPHNKAGLTSAYIPNGCA